ncbi:MAG: hypothetical protein KBG20_22585, partial [Caldilineaceae bacterium]|nr:hypothetical protein [Caldilineaceae bacterium]MBP9075113.1 hypothetical protein [Caldilineaceae bacterium]
MRFKRSIFLLAAALVGVLLTVQMFAAFNTAEAGRVAAPVSVEPAAAVDVAAWETITFDSNAVTYTLTGFEGAEGSSIVVDPTDAANKVAKVVKSATAQP